MLNDHARFDIVWSPTSGRTLIRLRDEHTGAVVAVLSCSTEVPPVAGAVQVDWNDAASIRQWLGTPEGLAACRAAKAAANHFALVGPA
jgi:hypothetical protein